MWRFFGGQKNGGTWGQPRKKMAEKNHGFAWGEKKPYHLGFFVEHLPILPWDSSPANYSPPFVLGSKLPFGSLWLEINSSTQVRIGVYRAPLFIRIPGSLKVGGFPSPRTKEFFSTLTHLGEKRFFVSLFPHGSLTQIQAQKGRFLGDT